MKRETAEAIVKAGKEMGLSVELYENYSGRFMFGAKTTAVTSEGMNSLLAAAAKAGPKVADDMRFLRRDDFGLGVIVY